MPFGLGFFATAGAGGAAGSFDLLESQVLGSDTASVTFSSLSTYASTYQHLQLRLVTRTTRNTRDDHLRFTFNGTGTSGSWHILYGNGSSVSTSAGTSDGLIFGVFSIAAATQTASSFTPMVLDLLDPFETTKNKTYRYLTGMTGLNNIVELGSGGWFNTSALSSIKIENANEPSNLVTGSRFSLYGIKAA